MSDKRRNRRWLRLSLRSTLIIATVICIWIGWYSIRSKNQREAVVWGRNAGGGIRYDFEFDYDKNLPSNGTTAVPSWLHEFLGIDYFSTVVSFDLSDDELADLTPVGKFTGLVRLQLWVAGIDDFSALAGLTNLKSLEVTAPRVDDLKPISSMAKLEYLFLNGLKTNDLTPLSGLTKLKELKLLNVPVSDLSPLAKLKELESLKLSGVSINDDEVARLQLALPNCKIVSK